MRKRPSQCGKHHDDIGLREQSRSDSLGDLVGPPQWKGGVDDDGDRDVEVHMP